MSLGDLARLDWHRAPVGEPQPCLFCGQDAILRHPITFRPCHKVCSDQRRQELIERAAAATTAKFDY
ncbi:hypothetical protein KGA66_06100 [Actinocrinis puniceicyclus]|uniref:Uncharacterized protein n=1 Tax=Actinocrinis puniceicyclus TaxID=977794 RepID=A0A8J7WHZ3_9ACTN|nr:hypothetical protein [Actinocrinis puniceicyclus]MBS2962611.1 hypothetical protein [Actinocrinis puniceicyclus]